MATTYLLLNNKEGGNESDLTNAYRILSDIFPFTNEQPQFSIPASVDAENERVICCGNITQAEAITRINNSRLYNTLMNCADGIELNIDTYSFATN